MNGIYIMPYSMEETLAHIKGLMIALSAKDLPKPNLIFLNLYSQEIHHEIHII
jgi:hypothetical protein